MTTIDTTLIRQAVANAGGQVKMAKAVNVSQGLVSNWCNGAMIASRHLAKIAEAGGVKLRALSDQEIRNAEARHAAKTDVAA
jgi:DNA-binding transcriptional regulator YdaS (Cro superfamily)